MKYSQFFFSLIFVVIVIGIKVKGCHYAGCFEKRSIGRNGRCKVERIQDLRRMFTKCLRRKARNAFESLESVPGYSLLDTDSFLTSASVVCRQNDGSACWKNRLSNYIKRTSPLFVLAAQCIDEYESKESRRTRPPTPPVCRNGRWTEFFDVDNPNGNSDSEQLSHINRVRPNRACSNPSAIDVRLLNGNDYRTAGQVVTVRRNGFTCENRRQPNNRRCLDYKVRFCCPLCRNGRWTRFFDRDNPSGNGDYETLRVINRENPRSACSNPTAVECRIKNSRSSNRRSKQVVTVDTTRGCVCENRRQRNRERCLDYEVRFCCPRS